MTIKTNNKMAEFGSVNQYRVVLWTAPRCLSSVFERSVRELKDVKVIYEPHQQAYYYGPERKTDGNMRTTDDINPNATYEAADEVLLKSHLDCRFVFIKNHAFFVERDYERYATAANLNHTFLIRHPAKSIVSLVKIRKKLSFDASPSVNGMQQLHDLFQVVSKHTGVVPVVIDADDLLMNPKDIMECYCNATGLPFNESMLTWTPGVVSDWAENFKYYNDWHGTAMMSSGFMKQSSVTQTPSEEDLLLLKECETAIQEALPYYEAMHSVRVRVK